MITELFGRDVPDDYKPDYAGRTDLSILYDLTRACGISDSDVSPMVNKIWQWLYNEFSEHNHPDNIQIMPGVVELIESLAANDNIELGLVTGNFRHNAYLKLEAIGLDKYFGPGAFGSDHADRNVLPPLAIARANELYGYPAFSNDNAIVIGDSPLDIECAKANDIPVLAVATGHFPVEELGQYAPEFLRADLCNTEETINIISRIAL